MQKFDSILTAIEDWTAGTLILGAALLAFLNVVLRYVFHSPLNWAGELVRLMIVWAAFVGSSIALRKSTHIRVNIIVNILPAKAKKWVIVFANVIGLVFCLFLIWQGSILAMKVFDKGQTSIDMGISMAWLYLSLPVGSTFVAIRFVQLIFNTIYKFDDNTSKGGH